MLEAAITQKLSEHGTAPIRAIFTDPQIGSREELDLDGRRRIISANNVEEVMIKLSETEHLLIKEIENGEVVVLMWDGTTSDDPEHEQDLECVFSWLPVEEQTGEVVDDESADDEDAVG